MGNESSQQSDLREDYRKALTRFNRGKVALVRSIFKNLTEASVGGRTIDKATFLQYFPLPGIMGERLYAVFDRDHSGGVDFQEFLTGMALIYRGTGEEKNKFLFEMYDLDGDGVVTREDLRTMLSHIPAAFKILETVMGNGPIGSQSGGEDPETRQRIEQIIDAAFANKGPREQFLNFSEFAEVVSQTPAILEIINIFYDEAIPENENASRTSMITDGNVPRVSMWSACQSGGQSGRGLLQQSKLQKSRAEPAATSSTLGSFARKLSSFASCSSRNSDAFSAMSGSSGVETMDTVVPQLERRACDPQLEQRARDCTECPLCGTVSTLAHCMVCGGMLRPGLEVEYQCDGCGWQMQSVKFCHQCGQSLRSNAQSGGHGQHTSSEWARVLGQTSQTRSRTQSSHSEDASSCASFASQSSGHSHNVPGGHGGGGGSSASSSTMGSPMGSPSSAGRHPFLHRSREPCLFKRGSCPENSMPVRELHALFDGRGVDDCSQPVLQGTLWKVGRKAKIQKSRYFVLQDRFLYYFAKQGDQVPKGVIFLEGSTVKIEMQEVPKGRYGLAVQQRGCAQKKVLLCCSIEERQAWLTALTSATRSPAIEDFYILEHDELGRGRFAHVIQARPRDDLGIVLAVKVISKAGISDEDREHVRTEVAILKLVDHPHVVRLVNIFDDPDRLYLVMEHVGGGDLLKRLLQLPEQRLDEPTSRNVLRCLLGGTQYLHDHGVTHRDLKPDNVLVEDTPTDSRENGLHDNIGRISSVKITDFGLSAMRAKSMKEPLGTMAYAAPEILQGRPYDQAVDVWSLGVMSFVVLAGLLPFIGDCDRTVARAVVQGQYSFDGPRWIHIGLAARNFVSSLLMPKAADRPTAGAALLHHPWFREGGDS